MSHSTANFASREQRTMPHLSWKEKVLEKGQSILTKSEGVKGHKNYTSHSGVSAIQWHGATHTFHRRSRNPHKDHIRRICSSSMSNSLRKQPQSSLRIGPFHRNRDSRRHRIDHRHESRGWPGTRGTNDKLCIYTNGNRRKIPERHEDASRSRARSGRIGPVHPRRARRRRRH